MRASRSTRSKTDVNFRRRDKVDRVLTVVLSLFEESLKVTRGAIDAVIVLVLVLSRQTSVS